MLALTLTPRDGVYEAETLRRAAYRGLLARVRELRGVEAAGGTLLLPFEHGVVGVDGGVVLEAEIVIRTDGDPAALAAAVASEVRRADPNFVIDAVAPLRGLVDAVMHPWRFNMTMAALLAGVAIVLAAIGLFGAVAYGVARRTREIGVRRALGAQVVDMLRLVWGQAIVLTPLGAAIGLGLALTAGELIRPPGQSGGVLRRLVRQRRSRQRAVACRRYASAQGGIRGSRWRPAGRPAR